MGHQVRVAWQNFDRPRKTEVEYFQAWHAVGFADQDVPRLEVAVQDPTFVGVLHACA
jgi:hypothetical protein